MTPRPLAALAAAAACAGGLVLAWLATFSAPGRWVDQAALGGFLGLRRPRTEALASALAHLGDPAPFALCAALLVGIALARRRARLAVVVAVVLVGANATTQVLKPLLPDDRTAAAQAVGTYVAPGSWPSGHATAAMALALAAVLVVPRRLRPAAAVAGGGFAVAVSYGLLALGWHFPSDVLAGYSVAALWTALGIAALSVPLARRGPAPRPATGELGRREVLAPVVAAAVACALAAALLLARAPERVIGYAHAHTTFVAGALAIAGLAAGFAVSLALVLRR